MTTSWAHHLRCRGNVWAATVAATALCALLSGAAHATTASPRVMLVGIDGLTFDILDPLIEAGRLPTFAALIGRGTRAVLQSERPMRSPALWTTVATGQPRSVHGIYDFVTGSAYWPAAQRAPERRLVTSDMRQARALWQLAADAGRRSLVVGWLNTWPAEPVEGLMVAPYVALGSPRQTSIKGRIYDDVDQQTYPAADATRIRAHVVRTESVDEALVRRIVDVPEAGSSLYDAVPRLQRYLYTVRWSLATALTNTAIIESELRRDTRPRLIMTYYDGADTLAHRFWLFRQPLEDIRNRLQAHGIDPALAEELRARLGNAVDGYYEIMDEMLARLLQAAGPETTVVLVSDHGWTSWPKARAVHSHVPFDGQHAIEGVFLAAGPGIEQGLRIAPLTLYDVAPTVLYLLDDPIPSSLPGKVATEMVRPSYAGVHPPVIRRTCDGAHTNRRPPARQAAEAEATPFGERELERLQSLGYVQ